MRLSIRDLHITFQERSLWTNRIIEGGLSTRLGILEETITDVNLIEISRKHSEYILTKKFSRREEGSKSGADWLWCIGEPGAWFPLLVQAKVINPKTLTCHALNYRSGEQRRLLIKFARRHRLFPTYCLYSQITDNTFLQSRSLSSLSAIDSFEWACTLVIPKFIRQLVSKNKKRQPDLLKYGIPWTFPLQEATHNESNKLAYSVAKAIKRVNSELNFLTSQTHIESPKNSRSQASRIRWENPDPEVLIVPNLPSIIARLISGKVSSVSSPIGGVGIISCLPIGAVLNAQKALPAGSGEVFLENAEEHITRKL